MGVAHERGNVHPGHGKLGDDLFVHVCRDIADGAAVEVEIMEYKVYIKRSWASSYVY